MPVFDPARLLAARVATRQDYAERDCILYALGIGVGAGSAASDPAALRHLVETELVPLPAFATMLAYPGAWYADPAYGLDPGGMVNGGQRVDFHAPLPPRGSVSSLLRVEGLTDKGAGRGLLIHTRRTVRLEQCGSPIATIRQTYFHRGAGGFGGTYESPRIAAQPVPDSAADESISVSTRTDAALIFRLSGDWNLIHADPAAARAAGFERPILQGLATFGMAAYAIGTRFGVEASRIEALYSAPVTPGDALLCQCWRSEDMVAFRVVNQTIGKVAIDRGSYLLPTAQNKNERSGEMP